MPLCHAPAFIYLRILLHTSSRRRYCTYQAPSPAFRLWTMPGFLVSREDSPTVSTSSNPLFNFGTRLGIVFIIQAAFLSLFAVLILLSYITYAAVAVRRSAQRRWEISGPLHWYFLSMLVAEAIQATGSIMDLKWVIMADVQDGAFCTAQGILKNIGDVSVALCTLAIAIHTFRAIVFRWHPEHPNRIATLVLCVVWSIVIIIMVVSAATHVNKQYWGDTQYWCWITKDYPVQQIALDYVFMWTTAFVNIILYIPLGLVIKGIVVVEGGKVKLASKGDRLDVRSRTTEPNRGVDAIALQMFFYPAIYTVTVLPIAIVRFRAFHDQHVPFAATVVADVLFSSSGLFNVLLFVFTRPSLLPRRNSQYGSHAISFSLRSRMTEGDVEQSYIGRPPMAIARGGQTQISTFLDGSDLNFDEGYDKPVTIDTSTRGKFAPSFHSYGGSS